MQTLADQCQNRRWTLEEKELGHGSGGVVFRWTRPLVSVFYHWAAFLTPVALCSRSSDSNIGGDVALKFSCGDDPKRLQVFFDFIRHRRPEILAYHDRSDGGLIVTLLEMAFCSRCGLDIDLPGEASAIE